MEGCDVHVLSSSVDFVVLLDIALASAPDWLLGDDDLTTDGTEEEDLVAISAASQPGGKEPTNPDNLPLSAVIFAYSELPTSAPSVPPPPFENTHMTENTHRRKRQHYGEKRRLARAQEREARSLSKRQVDHALSALWRTCKIVRVQGFDLAGVKTACSYYSGPKGVTIKVEHRFIFPLLEELIAAGFKLVRWRGKCV